MLPVTINLDAQIGTPYPRSAGFDTDTHVKDIEWLAYWNVRETGAVCLCGMDTYLRHWTIGVWWGET